MSLLTIVAAVVIGLAQHAPAEAARYRVECGVVSAYTAPDSGTSTAGSIVFGLTGTPLRIAPDATIPTAVGNFLAQGTGAPTCLRLTLTNDSKTITALAFTSSGTVCGNVVLDPSGSYYITANRVLTPIEGVTRNPGLMALLGASAIGKAPICLTFTIDTASGFPVGFTAVLALSGKVSLVGSTYFVGGAPEPRADMTPEVTAELDRAIDGKLTVTLIVTGRGTIDVNTGDVVVHLSYVVQVDPCSGPTPTPGPAFGHHGATTPCPTPRPGYR